LLNDDYNQLKFLESTSNIKVLLKEVVGKKPSTRLATGISVCLQQGRMFFDTAIKSPTEIKPLQIFYGMVGFAKALTLTRSFNNLETLIPSHGLIDITIQNSLLENIQLKILSKGTFQEFNNVICQFDRIHYFGKSSMPMWHFIPTTTSDKLSDKKINFKEVLARIPGLEGLYQNTFQENPKTWPISINYWDNDRGFTELRIDDPAIYCDRISMEKIVKKWREKFPFLNNWCLYEVTKSWGNSIIFFCNIEKNNIDEFSENFLIEEDGHFRGKFNFRNDASFNRIDFHTILPPLSGGLRGGGESIVEPYEGNYISEYSLYYLGMYLLSSLVRYHPQVWAHSLTRSVTSEKSADDRALAIIEEFMNKAIYEFSNMIIKALKIKIEQ
jgi:hypothetical protein